MDLSTPLAAYFFDEAKISPIVLTSTIALTQATPCSMLAYTYVLAQ
jgi:hypothetical protein